MTIATHLGSTDVTVVPVAHGLMSMTYVPQLQLIQELIAPMSQWDTY